MLQTINGLDLLLVVVIVVLIVRISLLVQDRRDYMNTIIRLYKKIEDLDPPF